MTKLLPEGPAVWVWTLIFSTVYVPLSWLDDLKFVSKAAVAGVGCCFVAVVLIVVVGIRYGNAPDSVERLQDIFDGKPEKHQMAEVTCFANDEFGFKFLTPSDFVNGDI